jgi:hypothetical protein
MNKSFQTLQALIENKIINADDFYTINFRKYSVQLQGKYNSKLIQQLSNDYGVEFAIEGGFTVGTMTYQDENGSSKVEFTFT